MRLDPNDAKLYVYAISVSGGKVKRIRNKPLVNLAPCDMRDRWQAERVGPACKRNTVKLLSKSMRLGNNSWISL